MNILHRPTRLTESELTQLAYLVAGLKSAPTRADAEGLVERVEQFNGPFSAGLGRQVRALLASLPVRLSRAGWVGVERRLRRRFPPASRAVACWVLAYEG